MSFLGNKPWETGRWAWGLTEVGLNPTAPPPVAGSSTSDAPCLALSLVQQRPAMALTLAIRMMKHGVLPLCHQDDEARCVTVVPSG